MTSKPWIPIERIEPFLHIEPLLVLLSLTVSAWVLYRLFLKKVSASRHASLRARFVRLASYLGVTLLFSVAYWASAVASFGNPALARVPAYLALIALILGAVLTVRLSQTYLYLYLFRVNMSVGVPRLIVNLFTVVLGTAVFCWLIAWVFDVRLAPLLATSAVFSIVLGLALQDTLGNLFSGVALQLDRPYRIGDWIEVQTGSRTRLGQIHEITWRATLLIGFSDELVSIPNRTIAQSEVTVFSHGTIPARRNQAFRFPFDAPIPRIKELLLESVRGVPRVLPTPEPTVLITEASESWLTFKLFYSIEGFDAQYRVGDQVIARVMEALKAEGLPLARPSLELFGRGEARA